MDLFWIWFNMLNIGHIKKFKMLEKYKIKDIFLSRKEIIEQFNLSNVERNEFVNIKYVEKSKEIVEYNQKNNIGIINIKDKNYPKLLKRIYNPPIILYYKGNLEVLKNQFVSICIGKYLDRYGQNVLKYIVQNLYKDNIGIVTKFEEYNKKIFFENVLKSNILVLASGIKESYYTKKGIILSEYGPDVIQTRKTNIKRNRIITGITNDTILIQTTVEDGAGYIVDNALEENRELWVIPADITKPVNYYTNELIKQGANVLTQYSDLSIYKHINRTKNM